MPTTGNSAAGGVPAEQRTKVFISYSRKDLPFAERLVGALNGRGFEAYLDKKDIAPGEPWQDRLAQLIRSADTVVFVITPDSVASPVCAWEVDEAERLGKRVVPVVWRTADHAKVPGRLSRLNYIFFNIGVVRKRRWFEIALVQLVAALETDIGWVREHTRYGELARAWEQSGRAAHDILRGNTLAAAEEWLRLRPRTAPEPTELQSAFIARSREVVDQEEVAQAEQVLRLRRATGAGFVAPARQALNAGVHEKALRYVVAGAILADDPAFEIVRELSGPATGAVVGSRTQAVLAGHDGAVFGAVFRW
jgi:TIR domain